MSAELLDYQWRANSGQSLKETATILRWRGAYYESIGLPAEANLCRKMADDIDTIASMQQELQ